MNSKDFEDWENDEWEDDDGMEDWEKEEEQESKATNTTSNMIADENKIRWVNIDKENKVVSWEETIYDGKGMEIGYKDSKGFSELREYDDYGYEIYYENTDMTGVYHG